MPRKELTREQAIDQAREAIQALAVASCDCPYESERELADEIKRLRALPEHSGPICDRCGVDYIPEGDGQTCTEGRCGGRVSWEATVDRLVRHIQGRPDVS